MLKCCTSVGDEGHFVCFTEDPRERQADPRRFAAVDRPGRILCKLPVCGINLCLRDRHWLGTAGANEQAQPALIEDRAFDGQIFDRWRAVVETRQRIRPIEPGDSQTQHRRYPLVHDTASTTSNMPIQPSSVNSDWWA